MDLGGHEGVGEMPMPISSTYSALHESAKLKMLTSGNGSGADDMTANNSGVPPQLLRPIPAVQSPLMDNSSSTPKALVTLPIGPPVVTSLVVTPGIGITTPTGPGTVTPTGGKKAVRYRECHKNHAASIGGHAIDGCGEFMPSGEEGTVDSLRCAACDCHRNFHRREVEGEPSCDCHMRGLQGSVKDRKRSNSVGPVGAGGGPSPGLGITPTLALPSSLGMRTTTPTPILMALSSGAADSDDQEQGLGSASPAAMKKRFRTKFSSEQKEKMCSFADKLGWKIQKHDEAAVQQFCSDVGVKRHVLKVWMHNNKHTLGKKILDVPTQQHQLVVAGTA